MQQLGADTEIPAKNASGHDEGDADVIATFGRLNGFTILIQVKAHQGFTNEWAVSQITTYKNLNHYQSSQMWVVSTCDDFSEQAKRDADAEGVRLITGLEFAQMLIENGVYSMPL